MQDNIFNQFSLGWSIHIKISELLSNVGNRNISGKFRLESTDHDNDRVSEKQKDCDKVTMFGIKPGIRLQYTAETVSG